MNSDGMWSLPCNDEFCNCRTTLRTRAALAPLASGRFRLHVGDRDTSTTLYLTREQLRSLLEFLSDTERHTP